MLTLIGQSFEMPDLCRQGPRRSRDLRDSASEALITIAAER